MDGQDIALDSEDIEVRLQAKSGWTAAQGKHCVVILSTDLTPELIREGLARDLVRLVQDTRKQAELHFSDRIRVYLVTNDEDLKLSIQENEAYILKETLGLELSITTPDRVSVPWNDFEISGQPVKIAIEVSKASIV